jgi:WD40 repeat protein
MILTKIKNKELLDISPKSEFENSEKIDIVFFVTLEGSLGQIIQINKEIYLFLEALQNFLIKKEENIGGFNYANWKMFKYSINQIKLNEIKYVKSIKTRIGTIYSIIKTNNNQVAAACGNEIIIIDDISQETNGSFSLFNSFPSLRGHKKNVLCLALLSENIMASGGEDSFIKIWNIEKRECINTIKGNYKRIDSLLRYQNNILIAGVHNLIKIIDITKKEELATLVGHTKSICSLIKINDKALVSSSYDNSIKIWNLNNQNCEFTLCGHDSPVFCILMLKDGRLASGSGAGNKSIKIWNLKQKKCEFTLTGHKREVRDMKQLSNDFILTASVDKTIKVWNIYKKVCVQTLVSHYDAVYCLCFVDNTKFVSGGRDQDIILWKC